MQTTLVWQATGLIGYVGLRFLNKHTADTGQILLNSSVSAMDVGT